MLDRTVYQINVGSSKAMADARLQRAAADVFTLMRTAGFLRQRTETGGVLVHGRDQMKPDGEEVRIAIIGIPGRFTPEQSYIVALEKFERLSLRPSEWIGDRTAWTTRNPGAFPARRWGGAIVISGNIISFSGLSEHADEALVIGAACLVGWLTREHAIRFAEISNNKLVANVLYRLPT